MWQYLLQCVFPQFAVPPSTDRSVTPARILITGSSDGIGRAAAQLLVQQGHCVTLHARNEDRAREAWAAVPQAENVLVGDLSSISDVLVMAEEAGKAGECRCNYWSYETNVDLLACALTGPWDCIVHNAGLGPASGDIKTSDGFAATFVVNSLAPYILTASMEKPARLLYLSSGLHTNGDSSLVDVTWQSRPFDSLQAYSDSKLHNVWLAKYVSRRWPSVQSCSLDPGLVDTKMTRAGRSVGVPAKAIADFASGHRALSGKISGLHLGLSGPWDANLHEAADIEAKQEAFVEVCGRVSGVEM
jgi:NAD(P)-dependent dehydrogenase (short-subunit alcohol dehydrogenase family)